jgi:hypothetical protein
MQLAEKSSPPRVLIFYRVYCGLLTVLAVLDILTGLALLVLRPWFAQMAAENPPPPLDNLLPLFLNFGPVLAAVSIGLGILMTVLFGLTFFLPRKPWVWIYHLALIGIGLTDPCFFLPCLILMIYWLKPHNRTYFGCDKWLS